MGTKLTFCYRFVLRVVAVLMLFVVFAISAQAEGPAEGPVAEGPQVEDSSQDAWGYSVYTRTNQGNEELSVEDGYTSIGMLLSRQLNEDSLDDGLGFFDLRGHIENDGSLGFNTHFGYRWLHDKDGTADKDQWVYGLNAGADGREHKNDWYYWCRVGAEALGYDWNFHLNGYLGCGDTDKFLALEAVGFQGSTLLIETLERRSLWGIDGTASRRLEINEDLNVTGSLTGYHFDHGNFEAATGGRVAVDVAYKDNLSIGGRTGWDTRFGFNGMITVAMNFGRGVLPRPTSVKRMCVSV